MDEVSEWEVHAILQSTASSGRARIPGAIQGDSGSERGAPAGTCTLCRAQPRARADGAPSEGLALEQLPCDSGRCAERIVSHSRLGVIGIRRIARGGTATLPCV